MIRWDMNEIIIEQVKNGVYQSGEKGISFEGLDCLGVEPEEEWLVLRVALDCVDL